jgi:hypothetical protein
MACATEDGGDCCGCCLIGLCCIWNRLECSDWIWWSFGSLAFFRATKCNKNMIASCFYHKNSHVAFFLEVPTPINDIWRAIKYCNLLIITGWISKAAQSWI